MTSLIQKIGRLSIKLLNRDGRRTSLFDPSKSGAEELKQLLNLLTINDLNIDPILTNDAGPYHPRLHNAPVTYMQIYKDSDVNICIFFLKNGVKLPLHDHPDMIGLLKVIHGTVSIQSYSMSDEKNFSDMEQQKKKLSCIHKAVKHPTVVVSNSDPACVVQPGKNNLHEISTVNGPAAFMDILSPPYGPDNRTHRERDCHYYIELRLGLNQMPQDSKQVLLIDIEPPKEFWCDQAEYCGPTVA